MLSVPHCSKGIRGFLKFLHYTPYCLHTHPPGVPHPLLACWMCLVRLFSVKCQREQSIPTDLPDRPLRSACLFLSLPHLHFCPGKIGCVYWWWIRVLLTSKPFMTRCQNEAGALAPRSSILTNNQHCTHLHKFTQSFRGGSNGQRSTEACVWVNLYTVKRSTAQEIMKMVIPLSTPVYSLSKQNKHGIKKIHALEKFKIKDILGFNTPELNAWIILVTLPMMV